MSDEQLTSFVRSLSEDEAVEWDLLVSHGVQPQRAFELISSARRAEPAYPTTRDIFEEAYKEFEERVERLHGSLSRLLSYLPD